MKTALAVLSFALAASASAAPDLDAAFDEAMRRYDLPGLAVGIVERGEIVYRRTGGELVAGEGVPVTADTLFKIASNSKPMTTAMLARLVDAGKLRWDDPVVRHLPGFRMADPWVGRNMQLRDLLIHNSGLRAGAGDLMLWPEPNSFTRVDVLNGLQYLQPVDSFRSRYQYDNLLYIVAGEVAAAAAGASYETLVRREVFEPLGLKRCQVGAWSRDAVGNVAQPHRRENGRNMPVRRDAATIAMTTMAAAGGIRCSLDDMLTWARAWLRPDKAWLSESQRAALWSAHTAMPVSDRQREWLGTHFYSYGYGWRLSDADGVYTVSHTGSLAGMLSYLTLLPDRDVGFVILMNGEDEDARTVLHQVLLKRYTAPSAQATVAHYATLLAQSRASAPLAKAEKVKLVQRAAATPAKLGGALGVYRDPWFGEASVCADGERVRFVASKSPLLDGTVMRSGDGWLVDWQDESVDAEAWLRFSDAAKPGAPRTLRMAKVDPEADFSYDFEDLAFVRVRGCEKSKTL